MKNKIKMGVVEVNGIKIGDSFKESEGVGVSGCGEEMWSIEEIEGVEKIELMERWKESH